MAAIITITVHSLIRSVKAFFIAVKSFHKIVGFIQALPSLLYHTEYAFAIPLDDFIKKTDCTAGL